MAPKPAKPRRVNAASIVVSAAVFLGVVLSFKVPWVGYGIVAALVAVIVPGYLAVVLFRGRRETPGAQRATLGMLVAFPIGAIAIAAVRFGLPTALVTAGTAAVLLYAMVFRAYFGSLAKVRAVAALRRALAAGDDTAIAEGVARAKTWRTAIAFQAIAALAEHGRVAEAEAVARAVPASAKALALDRAAWLVGFSLARGDVADARATIDAIDRTALPAAQVAVVEFLDARIRIAEGKAADVARELAAPAPEGLAPPLVDMRDLVRADAKAALNDKQGATNLVREVVGRSKRQSLAALAKTNRPLAPIAAALLKKAG